MWVFPSDQGWVPSPQPPPDFAGSRAGTPRCQVYCRTVRWSQPAWWRTRVVAAPNSCLSESSNAKTENKTCQHDRLTPSESCFRVCRHCCDTGLCTMGQNRRLARHKSDKTVNQIHNCPTTDAWMMVCMKLRLTVRMLPCILTSCPRAVRYCFQYGLLSPLFYSQVLIQPSILFFMFVSIS